MGSQISAVFGGQVLIEGSELIKEWSSRYGREKHRRIVRVTSISPKSFIASADQFDRDNRYNLAAGESMAKGNYSKVRWPLAGEIEEIKAQAAEAVRASEEYAAREREKERGTLMGFIRCAEEAMRAKCKELGEGEDKLATQVYYALSDLRTDYKYACEDLARKADTIKSQGDTAAQIANSDGQYAMSLYSSSWTDMVIADTRRQVYVKQAWTLIRMAAAFLGVTKDELIAPMAKKLETQEDVAKVIAAEQADEQQKLNAQVAAAQQVRS